MCFFHFALKLSSLLRSFWHIHCHLWHIQNILCLYMKNLSPSKWKHVVRHNPPHPNSTAALFSGGLRVPLLVQDKSLSPEIFLTFLQWLEQMLSPRKQRDTLLTFFPFNFKCAIRTLPLTTCKRWQTLQYSNIRLQLFFCIVFQAWSTFRVKNSHLSYVLYLFTDSEPRWLNGIKANICKDPSSSNKT